jgi:IS30 family transposase
MDLQKTAESESERRTRSKLEPHREAIFALRRKHWTYDQIAKWLGEHGVSVTLTTVYRFCERAIARRPRNANPPQAVEGEPLSVPPPTKQTNRHRFKIDI